MNYRNLNSSLLESIKNELKEKKIFTDKLKENFSLLENEFLENTNRFAILANFGHRIKTQNAENFFQTILETSRKLTNSDAGTVYSLEEIFSKDPYNPTEIKKKHLVFRIMQNESMEIFLGGAGNEEINIPPVELLIGGKPNNANVSAYCANHGEMINLEDVYNAEGFDFSGTKKYDQKMGYRSKSMLVFPLHDPKGKILGVLQLINRRNAHGKISAFNKTDEELLFSLAMIVSLLFSSQTLGIAHQKLFDAFIKIIAQGLGEKSAHTYEHISKVNDLSLKIAHAISENQEGIYKDVNFSPEDYEIISISAWMHDIGKMTTPEHIVAKSKKLQQISDRMELILERINSKIKDIEIESLKKQLALADLNNSGEADKIRQTAVAEIKKMKSYSEFLYLANTGGEFLTDERIEMLNKVCDIQFNSHFDFEEIYDGEDRHEIGNPEFRAIAFFRPIVNKQEKENLMIRRGTLNEREREIIKNHAERSWRWLNALPFPCSKRSIPLYAGAHHECLDGSGYPNQLRDSQLPLQARILAVADIFEALTASDRPYNRPKNFSGSLKIFGHFMKNAQIDPEITRIFIQSEYFQEYIRDNLLPEQNDLSEVDLEVWLAEAVPKNFRYSLPRETWSGN